MKLNGFITSVIITLLLAACSGITDGLQHNRDGKGGNILYGYTIAINDFQDVTYTRDVVISINPGDATEIRFSNDGLSWSAWESALTSRDWILTEFNSVKTVYAEFRKDGTVISSSSDDIRFIEKLIPVDGVNSDIFGSSVAVTPDGNTIVMGGENHRVTTPLGFIYRPGGAVIYRHDGIRWSSAVITPNGSYEGERFGASVSVSDDGNTVAVGSPGFDSNSGRVSLYRYNVASVKWEYIMSVTGSSGSNFGNSVALSGNGSYLLCGAVSGSSRKGEARLYSVGAMSLILTETFTIADGLEEDRFGCSVSIDSDGSVFAVGAEQRKISGFTNSGIVYLFRNTGGGYIMSEISPVSPVFNSFFGCSVSVSDDGSVISAGARGYSNERGRVFVFRDNGTDFDQYDISDGTSAEGDQFGYSVAVTGDGSAIAAGSPFADKGKTDSGKLVWFAYSGSAYISQGELSADDPTEYKYLGVSAGINDSASVFAGGGVGDIYSANECGTSYIFRY